MNQFGDIKGRIIRNSPVVAGYHLLAMKLESPMPPVEPGQFVMIKTPSPDIFLRRPFSIYDYKRGVVSILFKIAGKGTDDLAQAKTGAEVTVLGPLGNGFSICEGHHPILVAGGIGLAGIHLLHSRLKGKGQLFWGCGGAGEKSLIDGLSGKNINVASMDGSYGFKGTVVDLLAQRLPELQKPIHVLSCGPHAMFTSLRELLAGKGISVHVLLEEKMACGIGICFGCVTKTTDAQEPYKRVCKEGPVFDLWQISL
jgi:dihydroorotate dehydrogenase electron transfer subunit